MLTDENIIVLRGLVTLQKSWPELKEATPLTPIVCYEQNVQSWPWSRYFFQTEPDGTLFRFFTLSARSRCEFFFPSLRGLGGIQTKFFFYI